MKKKYYTGIMMVAVSMAITACGGGSSSPKNERAELAAELEKELSADDKAAIKEAQTELKGEDKKKVSNESVDLNDVGIQLNDVDPYSNNIFEMFGLDNDFPKPEPDFSYNVKYSTKEYKIDEKTGKKPEGIESYNCYSQRAYYSDYLTQIEEYVLSKHPEASVQSKDDPTGKRDRIYYKYDDKTYTIVTLTWEDGLTKNEYSITRVPYEPLEVEDKIRWVNYKEKDGIKNVKIQIGEMNNDPEVSYCSTNQPDLPYDLQEGEVVKVQYDSLSLYSLKYVNSVERK
ncbi:hypothetical protein MCJ35_17265 [Enterocloster sp. OA13]|uniref:hypothetical protein n=1 Tax=Enterocloster sp. OA13 TaxID=2914161 RepID=UPI0004715E44|nr:hypothetical protein [Enterocloster sp. OA13]